MRLAEVPGITIYGPAPAHKGAIVSFTMAGAAAQDPLARVELIGAGKDAEGRPEYFEAQVTQNELASLGLSPGQNVRLVADRLRLFERANGTQGR